MLSRKSAVISKLSVTRDSLMRSPFLLSVYLPLHSSLSFSPLLSVSLSCLSLFNGRFFFFLSGPFSACVFVWEQARDSVWSQREQKKASYEVNRPQVLNSSEFLRSFFLLFFMWRCVQLQRSVFETSDMSSSFKAGPLFFETKPSVYNEKDYGMLDQTAELKASRDQGQNQSCFLWEQ